MMTSFEKDECTFLLIDGKMPREALEKLISEHSKKN